MVICVSHANDMPRVASSRIHLQHFTQLISKVSKIGAPPVHYGFVFVFGSDRTLLACSTAVVLYRLNPKRRTVGFSHEVARYQIRVAAFATRKAYLRDLKTLSYWRPIIHSTTKLRLAAIRQKRHPVAIEPASRGCLRSRTILISNGGSVTPQ